MHAGAVTPEKLALTAAAASVAECVTYPVDATKTRLQLQGEKSPPLHREGGIRQAAASRPAGGAQQRGAVGMGIHILQTEGVRGLYRGLLPGVVRHCLYSSSRICLYENFRHRLSTGDGQLSMYQRAVAGGTAGLIGQALASPADLVKVRMQADGRYVAKGHPPRYTGFVHALRHTA